MAIVCPNDATIDLVTAEPGVNDIVGLRISRVMGNGAPLSLVAWLGPTERAELRRLLDDAPHSRRRLREGRHDG